MRVSLLICWLCAERLKRENALCDLAHCTIGQISVAPRFKLRPGYIRRVFHLSLRLITFGGRSAHLAYLVHKGGLKTATSNEPEIEAAFFLFNNDGSRDLVISRDTLFIHRRWDSILGMAWFWHIISVEWMVRLAEETLSHTKNIPIAYHSTIKKLQDQARRNWREYFHNQIRRMSSIRKILIHSVCCSQMLRWTGEEQKLEYRLPSIRVLIARTCDRKTRYVWIFCIEKV